MDVPTGWTPIHSLDGGCFGFYVFRSSGETVTHDLSGPVTISYA